jgi:hypothetical protein
MMQEKMIEPAVVVEDHGEMFEVIMADGDKVNDERVLLLYVGRDID